MKVLKTPPPSPSRQPGGEDAKIGAAATPEHSPAPKAEAQKSSHSNSGAGSTVDLTPVIRNSGCVYADDALPDLLVAEDDEEFFLLPADGRAGALPALPARGLRQRTSTLRLSGGGAGNSSSTAGTGLSGGASTASTDESYESSREGRWGDLLLGERLGMATDGTASNGAEKSASIFKQVEDDPAGLAPVELSPDRRFRSFQGAGQYRRRVVSGKDSRAPARPDAVPCSPRGSPERRCRRQYQPSERGQHGVEELADARDLDAIFKSPRKKPGEEPCVVSPDSVALGDVHEPWQPSLQQPSLEADATRADRPPQAPQQPTQLLSCPYPIDERDWSIPSIRLANHVSGGGSLEYSFASAADLSECTVEDDLEGGSLAGLLDDDESSLDMSAGSSWARRRRRVSGIFQRKRSTSEAMADRIPQTVFSQDVGDAALPGPSPVGPAPPREGDAENGAPLVTVLRPSRNLEVLDAFGAGAPPAVVDVADADKASRPSRGPKCKSGARRRKEGAAAEWLHELQDRSHKGSASSAEEGGFLIAEAASSRFLRPPDAAAEAEDLGTPRPLCRSSTIGEGGARIHLRLHDG